MHTEIGPSWWYSKHFSFLKLFLIKGAKVYLSSTGSTRIICCSGESYDIKSDEERGLPDDVRDLLQHTKQCFQRCKELESCVDSLQCDQISVFPLTVSRRPAMQNTNKDGSNLAAR